MLPGTLHRGGEGLGGKRDFPPSLCWYRRLAECACGCFQRWWEISGSHSTENSDAKAVGRPGQMPGVQGWSVLQIAATAMSRAELNWREL